MIKATSCLLIFVFVLLGRNDVVAQMTTAQVDSLMLHAMQQFKVAGAAVAIVKDGKVVHQKGYGVKSILTRQPVDANTNFQIASNSKAFATAGLAILVDEGKLSWKDKVVKYIPEFKMYNAYVTENFLIEDLLCHRSGLGLGAGDLMFFPDGSDFTIKDVATNFQYFKPVSPFRTKYDYDNLLYLIAGEITARVSGMSWEQFIQIRILQPLEMHNSATSFAGLLDKTSLAMPHSTEGEDGGKMKTFALSADMINGAAAGILSNVADMSKWMMMQLNGGKYGDSLKMQLLSPKSKREMWKVHTVQEVNSNPRYNSHFAGYGLGWQLTDVKGNLNVSHTGGMPGMLSKVSLVPDQKLGIVILTNTENGGSALFTAVHNTILDSYLGLDNLDWVGLINKSMSARKQGADSVTLNVWKQVAASKKTKFDPQHFVGLYEDNWFGKVEVFLKKGQLWIRSYRSPKLNGPMHFYSANVFAVKWEYRDMNCDAFADFTVDETGKAQSIKMRGISPSIDFSFDFQDLDLRRVAVGK
jgi:CubicO group peptidase (beta-lactamase class C family)